MPVALQIAIAREHLAAGNECAYAAQIRAGIRGAMTSRAIDAFRRAIAEDETERLFDDLATIAPRTAF